MVDADAFAKMKSQAYIVSTSRGGIIDEGALAQALELGSIAGAALGTTEREPLPKESPLWACKNCLVTPHMAWYSEKRGADLQLDVGRVEVPEVHPRDELILVVHAF
jgi:D-3-phosphoglycerate dehydrogenase